MLTHVRRSISWYHDLSTVDEINLPGIDAMARSKLQQQALTALRLAFQSGDAAGEILSREAAAASRGKSPPPPPGTPAALASQLSQEAVSLSAREQALNSDLTAIDRKLRHTRAQKTRATLTAQRAGIAAALQLVRQIESNVDQLRRFEQSVQAANGRNPGSLLGQLAELEQSVPELADAEAQAAASGSAAESATRSQSPAASAAAATKPAATFRPESAGIVSLIGQWLKLHGYQVQLEGAIKDTSALANELQSVRSQVLATVRQLVGRGLAAITAGSSAQLAGQRESIQTATERLRALSGVIVPLGEQALALSNAQSTLDDWSQTVAAQESTVASYLGLRSGFLLALIAAVFIVSEIWRRATFRYLQDARRRRPFLVLRRLVVGIALTLVVIFGLVSEVGSIATYAGFVTAGLAVALQNVILAVVAYFFLIGRYGVRVGDRVTISGVTGRVVDISLLRLYLMELAGPDLHSTGRMVVLSNAVIFQPTALFKQIPGAEYLWHSVTLTIVATADVEEAYRRLEAAAHKVYDGYRPAIERQHAQAQRFIEFETATPAPEVHVQLTDNGLECVVRYPVVPEKSARIDQQMLESLRRAVESDEQLKLVASGGVMLKSAET